MAEYIERKRAIVDACNSLELYPSEYAKLEDALNKIPAADVAPVRHGRWVHDGQRVNGGVDWYHCSECLHPVAGVYAKRPFCSMCGGKMDLEDHDGK